jgi:two-component system, OmpR family, alkaline phosphatase synthesis response regulator PhoP
MVMRVLVVDDEPSILMTLELVLKTEGFEVHTASSSSAAKSALAQIPFDLVVTDLSMETPNSGYDIVRVAKQQPIKPATLVVSGFPDLLGKWQSEGADAGLQKPTEVPELLATINRLVVNR